jgi:hypothetical protein
MCGSAMRAYRFFELTSRLMDLVTFIMDKHLLIFGDEIQIWTSLNISNDTLISRLEEQLDLMK